ncbi:MAG: hypothetical protein Alpg2KO_29830 [Alphaproteobacteria bacterium]
MPYRNRTRRGASLLSYGLIVGLISVVALATVENVGGSVTGLFGVVDGQLTSVTGGGGSGSDAPDTVPGKQVLTFTGSDQSFDVPDDAEQIEVRMWGAGGGGGAHGQGPAAYGGAGGYTEAQLAVTPGETLTVIVGGGGTTLASLTSSGGNNCGGPSIPGGYGGGGSVEGSNTTGSGGSGGGRSAIRRGSDELVTAGGGSGGNACGGGGVACLRGTGRPGGGTGGDGLNVNATSNGHFGLAGGNGGTGATYSSGASTYWRSSSADGSSFQGGNGRCFGAAGGGGYVGGGGGSWTYATESGTGGGGSGFVGGAGVTSGVMLQSPTPAGTYSDPTIVDPPNVSDADYIANIGSGTPPGRGGAPNGVPNVSPRPFGGNGLVVICWPDCS